MILHEPASDAKVGLINIPLDDDLSDKNEINDSQLGEAIVADVSGTQEIHIGN